jgi:carboxypeptidase family protein/TonB-dependent receptor-like protein
MRRFACLVGMVALAVWLSAPAAAQETRGSIEGLVKDTSGAVLPGVTVEAKHVVTGGVSSVVSGTDGAYRFPALPPGEYQITSTLSGFQTSRRENVRLELGQILKIDFAMSVASITESVQVTAESPIIDVKQNAATLSIQADVIERIPKGRNFTSVLTTAPGTNQEAKAGLSIDGATGAENRYIIDGMDTTNLRTGVSAKPTLVDFLTEVQVKSSGYNAEYRATTGGVVSAVTKSGGNVYHGGLGIYYSNDDWLGDVRPSLRLNPANQTLAEYIRTPRDKGYNFDPVFDLGGPILQNRAWFYAGYGPQFSRAERTVRFNSNNETRTFQNDSDDHNLTYTVSSQLNQSLRFKFAGSNQRGYGGSTLPGKEPDGSSNSNPTQFPNPLHTNSTNDAYSGELAWVVSPKFFVNTNVGYFNYNTFQVTDTQFSTALRHLFGASNTCTGAPGSSGCPFPEIPASLRQLNGYSDNPVSTRNARDKFGRVGVSVDGTYYGNFKGQHTIKAGVQWERLSNDVLTGAQAPTVTINWNANRSTLDDPPQQVRGTYGHYVVSRSFTEGKIHSNNIGLFIQDAWTLNDRLTLNLGVRSDAETIPSYRPENPSLEFGLSEKIAPRVGFAYDITGNSRWKAYGSWGMFYDISKLEMPRGAWGADRWIDYAWTLDTFDWPSITCDGTPTSGCPGRFIEQADRRHVSNDPDDNLIDPNLKPIRTQEFTLGVDHELTPTMSVGVRYAHKWLDRTIEDVGIQVAGVGEVFMIANPGFGIAEFTLAPTCPECPAQPKAKRVYDGLEFRLRKRLSNRWYVNTSYTYSRLVGNYSGLSSSDENGRNSPSVLRFFDGLYMSYDAHGNPIDGRLQTDRPHYFKFQGTYDLPWGTMVGVNFSAASGTLQQSTVTYKSVPVFDDARGNLGRTPVYSFTDLLFQHEVRVAGTRVNLGLNIDNLFDQDTVTRQFQARYRDSISGITDAQFLRGFDVQALAQQRALRPDPRFTLADQFLGARSFRVQARFSF